MRVSRGTNLPEGGVTSRSSKTTVPAYSGPSPTRSPVLTPTNVTVQAARTASPSGTPASLSRPEGTSSENTGRPLWLIARIAPPRAAPPPPLPRGRAGPKQHPPNLAGGGGGGERGRGGFPGRPFRAEVVE